MNPPAGHRAEPDPAVLGGGWRRRFLATRPAFLTVTALGVALGWACAWRDGLGLDGTGAVLTLVFALVAHAGANVVNDFHDRAGDALNTERLFPFTGGSRFIQNGVLTPGAVARLGYGLLAAVVPAGLWLAWRAGSGLVGIGAAGLFLGWAYSAPPLRLSARGLGEAAIALGWALVVAGSDYVQRGAFAAAPACAGLAYGLMVADLLYINQFPDAVADAAAGKRTVVVRLGRARAAAGYGIIAAAAGLVLSLATVSGALPASALVALPALVPAFIAWRRLRAEAERPQRLRPAILATLAAVHLFGLLLAAALAFA